MSKRRPKTDAKPGDEAALLALRLFDKFFPEESWKSWRAWTAGLVGAPMTAEEEAMFLAITGRSRPPSRPAREGWLSKGRRTGGTRQASFQITLRAGVLRWKMAPGERPYFPIVTPSRRQGAIALNYCAAMLEILPGVHIVRRTVDELELDNGAIIRIETASFRTSRGASVPAAFVDEGAFMRDDSGANPFREILRALRPALASVEGSLLMVVSTPYSARDVFHETFERHYGRDDSDILFGRAPTRLLNPTIPQSVIDNAMAEDPSAAAAEWNAEFRSDLETMFSREALAAVTVRDRHELPPIGGCAYVGFIDPAGGSGADSMTLGIAHRDPDGHVVLDRVREVKPPFAPSEVVETFVGDLQRYSVTVVFSDRYAAEWPREQFARKGITVEPTEFTRSELYLELLPIVNSRQAELLDNPRLLGQLADLERRTGISGKDSVDHRRGQHDDLANAAAGALAMAVQVAGLKAIIPAEFRTCYRAASGLPPLGPRGGCYLLGGVSIPPGDICCNACIGHSYVKNARHAHEQRIGQAVSLVPFFKAHFGRNPFQEKLAWAELREYTENWVG